MTFVNAIRSEFAKIFTTRLWWLLLLVLFGYIAFVSGLLAGIFGGLGEQLAASGANAPQIPVAGLHLLVYSLASSIGYVFPVLFGALATTTEFRHQTLTPTFLATPRRGQVLGAKVIALAIMGAIYGVVALVASMGVGGGVLSLVGQDAALGSADTWALAGRLVIAMALWAVIGVGLGALVKSQVAAIVIVLAFTQFLEPILRAGTSIWEWTAQVGKFLPGAASDALVGSSIFSTLGMGTTSVAVLEWWQGGIVLLALALVIAIAGYLSSWRKDVT